VNLLKAVQRQAAIPAAASGVYRFGAAVALFILVVTSSYLWLDQAIYPCA
jgi:formate hydrogenlyase subunit 4